METTVQKTVHVVDVEVYRAVMEEQAQSATRRDDERQDAKRLRLLGKYEKSLCEPKLLVTTADKDDRLKDLLEEAPNAREVLTEVVGQLRLARRGSVGYSRLAVPVLLLGEPGIGKSRVARLIPKVLGVESETVRLGGMTEAFAWSGLDLGYGTGKEGLMAEMLARHRTANWLLVLDELDKGSMSPGDRPPAYEPLLQFLEGDSASAFRDVALGVDLNCSWLAGFVATANDIDVLPAALRDRFVIHHVPRPSPDEMRQIVQSIWRDICRSQGWDNVLDVELDECVVDRLSTCTPRRTALALRQAATRRGARLTKYRAGNKRIRIALEDLKGLGLEQPQRRAIGFHARF